MIHWTRQIKELLASQESMEMADGSGPLEEIEFWRARCQDLSGLTKQLNQPGILQVISIVERAKSSYLQPFRKLSRQIQVSITHCFQQVSSFRPHLGGDLCKPVSKPIVRFSVFTRNRFGRWLKGYL